MNLILGSEQVATVREAMAPLEGMEPLRKFVHAYANVNPDGGRLAKSNDILEGLLFAIWLEACAALDVRVSDPTIAAIHSEDDDAD